MDIIVLAGGLSTERDVSFKTGSMVASALKENGHRVILLDVFMGYSDKEENLDGIFDRADEISVKVDDIPEVAPDLAAVKASRKDQSPCFFGPNVIRMCQMADIVFMALHGENGENGKLQAAFDLLGVKYTGSDYLSSAIAMNKGMAKQLFASAGIPAPRGIAMKKENREDDVTKLPLTLPPCFFGPNVIRMCQMADIVFMALHGENGENGKLQAAFDLLGVKYTGSDYLSSAIAMNKGMAKQLFASAGIPAPRGIAMKKENREDDVTKLPLTLPCVVKPCCGGSSIGVTIVRDAAEFKKALDEAFHWEDELVIEEYVKGREFSVGVIEGKALPVIEIAPIQGFYDYKNKYKAGSAVETCPADLPEEVSAQMRKYAEQVAEVIGLDTYSRSDFLLDENNHMYCLEANTLPGMTPTSLLPQEAAVIGINFNELCEKLIAISMKKYEG